MKPTGAAWRGTAIRDAAAWRRFGMRIAYRHAVPPALVESNTVASRKSAEKSTAKGCLVQGPATEEGFFFLFLFLLRIARAKGSLGRLRYSLYVLPYLDRALLFEYGTGEMTSAEYQSHREAGRIFIDCYLDSDDAGSAERVWSAFCYCARSL